MVLLLLSCLFLVGESEAKSWRAIVPLKSTRADVERALGKEDKWGRYQFADERGSIHYRENPCVGAYRSLEKDNCECMVSKDTVVSIFVTLEASKTFSSLHPDKTKFQRRPFNAGPAYVEFINLEEGVIYSVDESDDEIVSINYVPTDADCKELIARNMGTYRNPWRGIIPLHSTRADVEKLIGSPLQSNGITYDLKSERVNVVYSAGICEKDRVEWNVPPDTVIGITIHPQKRLMMSDLGVALGKFDKFINPQNPDFIAYNNKEEGMGFGTKPNGEVEVIQYFPAARDSHLRCANFSRSRVTLSELEYYKFDEFAKLSRSDERARLNNFATRLSSHPDTKAYVIVYPGKREKKNIAKASARRIKRYLINPRRVNPARVETIIGGQRESSKTELFVVPSNIIVLRN